MTDQIRRRQISGHCDQCRRWAVALDRDHIVPLSWGGKHDRSNIQYLCKPCHKRKTAHERRTGPPRPVKQKRGGCAKVLVWGFVILAILAFVASVS